MRRTLLTAALALGVLALILLGALASLLLPFLTLLTHLARILRQ